jgi:tRNA nucleotidyltransferase/poly(A) polymerase
MSKSAAQHKILMMPLVRQIHELAKAQGSTAYLVGGAVRDWLLSDTVSPDLDFTLVSTPERNCSAASLAKMLADSAAGHLVALDWEYGIHRVVFDDGMTVDLADALENNLQTDLLRRDLTINALAMDLNTGEIIDFCQGQKDLETHTIRMVSEFNHLDDPLRMLPVFRVAATMH